MTNERGKQDQIECADIGAHLAHHGLNVVIKRMPLGDLDVAAMLLSHAADEDDSLGKLRKIGLYDIS